MNELTHAEDIGHYWQTSRSSPDQWMEKAKRQIERLGGEVLVEGFGSSQEKEAYMLGFEIEGERYKIIWPVLPSKSGKQLAARRQAATTLYHDVKAKTITASVLGTRIAFFSYKLLPDGRVASQLEAPEIADFYPPLLIAGSE